MNVIVIYMLALLVTQQLFFMWQIQKLVNKLLAGSYREYSNVSEGLLKTKLPEVGVPEDLRSLQSFQM